MDTTEKPTWEQMLDRVGRGRGTWADYEVIKRAGVAFLDASGLTAPQHYEAMVARIAKRLGL